jgi:uncharacterized protein (DUF885 family)
MPMTGSFSGVSDYQPYRAPIDDTIIDFHSGKLKDHSEVFEDMMLCRTREARAGLDGYGPKGLVGQELLRWKIAAWFLEDSIRQAEIKYGGYRVNQLSGVTVDLPQFLTDIHVIKSERIADRNTAILTCLQGRTFFVAFVPVSCKKCRLRWSMYAFLLGFST